MKTLTTLCTLALLIGVASAQTRTRRHGFDYPGDEAGNRTMNKLDDRVPGAITQGSFIACGQLANNGTIFLGPSEVQDGSGAGEGLGSATDAGSTICNALDNATETSIDAAIFTNNAIRVTGMYCRAVADGGTTGSGSNGVVFTLRADAADLTPSVTCTVATTGIDCYASGQRSTAGVVYDRLPQIAAGGLVAVKAVSTEDLSAMDGWCRVFYTLETR